MGRYYNDYYSVAYSPDYLEHHGIAGQKWGNRRYQYEDGSLTPEGRQRYGFGELSRNVTRNGIALASRKNANVLQRMHGRNMARLGTSVSYTSTALKNRMRSYGNSKGLGGKVKTYLGVGKEARDSNNATLKYMSSTERAIANTYKNKFLRNNANRYASNFEAHTNASSAYNKSRDSGKGILTSMVRGQGDYFSTKMTTITGKPSTVGKELVKQAIAGFAIGTAANVISAKAANG